MAAGLLSIYSVPCGDICKCSSVVSLLIKFSFCLARMEVTRSKDMMFNSLVMIFTKQTLQSDVSLDSFFMHVKRICQYLELLTEIWENIAPITFFLLKVMVWAS